MNEIFNSITLISVEKYEKESIYEKLVSFQKFWFCSMFHYWLAENHVCLLIDHSINFLPLHNNAKTLTSKNRQSLKNEKLGTGMKIVKLKMYASCPKHNDAAGMLKF